MAYLNQAGTSWPKPNEVQQACQRALLADPKQWEGDFVSTHWELCRFLGVQDSQRLLLTPGCTSALAVAIQDHDWKTTDRVLTSSFEHHAVMRPLQKLTRFGTQLGIIPPAVNSLIDIEWLASELQRGGVRMVVVTAACNVTGELVCLEDVIHLARKHGALTLVDMAQVVGWRSTQLDALGADMVAFGAHKGLLAPWGIGGLYVRPDVSMTSEAAACEISAGGTQPKCAIMPGYCDVGSVDRVALAGLQAAIQWHANAEAAKQQAASWAENLAATVEPNSMLERVSAGTENHLPVVAIRHRRRPVHELYARFQRAGVTVAAGLQCAPAAHETLGSAQDGLVRLSVGPMNCQADIDLACEVLEELD